MKKTLNVTDMTQARERVPDIETKGNPGAWVTVCKASSAKEGWMKSTKAMQIDRLGVLVQVSTQQDGNVAEALTFVYGARIVGGELKGGG